LGVRVPAIIASPWVDKGVVIHHPKNSFFEHSSVAATLRKMMPLDQGPLTHREAWAGTFEFAVNRKTPRTDCPMQLPIANGYEDLYKEYIKNQKNSRINIEKL